MTFVKPATIFRRLGNWVFGVPVEITTQLGKSRSRAWLREDGLVGAHVHGKQKILNSNGTVTGGRPSWRWSPTPSQEDK